MDGGQEEHESEISGLRRLKVPGTVLAVISALGSAERGGVHQWPTSNTR
jgi:hypothetical protein